VAVGVYQDRLEITSSGDLHFGLTAEKLFQPHESLPWNPLLARVFYLRGLIESWGRGTLKMAELTTQAGLPLPEIEEAAGCVLVRFRPSRYIPPARIGHDLTDRQRQVLELLGTSPAPLSLRQIVSLLTPKAPATAIKEDLQFLKTLGLVSTSGHGRGASWKLGAD
jgi:ATP-dependent DNA helicase RecG